MGSFQNELLQLIIVLPNKKILLTRLTNGFRNFVGRWEAGIIRPLREGYEDVAVIKDMLPQPFGFTLDSLKDYNISYVGKYSPNKLRCSFIYVLKINDMINIRSEKSTEHTSVYYTSLLKNIKTDPENYYVSVIDSINFIKKNKKEALLME